MGKTKFDPNVAFKNIIRVAEKDEQGGDEISMSKREESENVQIVTITGNTEKEETRSKRVNLIVRPSVYNLAKIKCEKFNISLNECINQFLEKWSSF